MSRFEVTRTGRTATFFDAAAYPRFEPSVFDRSDWHVDPGRTHTQTGRGGVRMLDVDGETWVRRHYHRGGFVSRFVYDAYVWTGLARCRPLRELELLARMRALGLPVPMPVAGRVVVTGVVYRADLITVLLPGTRPLSGAIAAGAVDPSVWPRIGEMIRRIHSAGVDHPDLTAHNILLDAAGRTYLLDFDNARVRAGDAWMPARLARLRRSLGKVALETGTRFDTSGWSALSAAYASA